MAKPRRKKKHTIGIIICVLLILLSLLILAAITMEHFNPGVFSPASVPASSKAEQPPRELSLDRSKTTLYVTTSQTLKVKPEDAEVSWSSSDPSVATVNNTGQVQAVSPGAATITAAAGGSQASCAVTVIPLPEVTVENPAGVSINAAALDRLRALTAQHPLTASLYYRDLGTGTVVEYNSSQKYACGSVIKAPYCKWIIASGADLNEKLTLRQKDIQDKDDAIVAEPVGTEFTVQQLIDSAIVYSDNTAYAMLAARFGFDGFHSYAHSLGVSANQNGNNLFGSMSAVGAEIYFADIYQWSLQNPDLSRNFMNSLKNTSYQRLISEAVDHPVAHKFGYNGGTNGFHDAAIVYSDHPYILTIFTYLSPDAAGTVDFFHAIASCIDDINAKQ